ncbi:VOC family protein [Vulcaniibacterium tengchongense]|uniref:Putative glyoxalase superfamily protein PhnB n=1 Tax=Vulcaniibacterium tengchongense TaxID=1273429 RepID=A0A3N4V3W2_9GAMM|nr:glyoxalase/bleomycin resistance/extradiol dioxygenase family protein [Vulcaniibacterium tengchongense]RPE77178.1 putative glyoxalase superfamily protein PhnB [Vulcaniibacterium tengchongense]
MNTKSRDALIPYLTVDGAARAIDFYKAAFGAEELARMPAEDGKRLMHAHLRVNGHDLMLSDAFPEYGAPTAAPAAVTLHLAVDDADAWWNRAVEAGAEIAMALEDQFWGDRYGQLRDPFGHRWSIGSPSRK